MKLLPFARLLALASLGLASTVFADDDRRDRRDSREQKFEKRGGHGHGRNPHHHHLQRFDGDREFDTRGPDFRRGAYLPRQFRNRVYVINDYRPYRLSAPPRGHQWVQVGADYMLVAIATGIIANIVLNQ